MVPPETCMNCQPVTPKHSCWIITYTKICMILKHVSIKYRQVHAAPFNKYSRIVRCEKKVTNKWENTPISWTKHKNDAPNENKKREGKDLFLYTDTKRVWAKSPQITQSDRADKEYPYLYIQKWPNVQFHWSPLSWVSQITKSDFSLFSLLWGGVGVGVGGGLFSPQFQLN